VTQDLWSNVDHYLAALLAPTDAVLDATLAAAAAGGLPDIQVSPVQGKLLHLIARVASARRILEIGTLAGYSTIWLARALPADGRLVTLEAESRHAEVARSNIERAGLSRIVEIRIGRAIETLPRLASEDAGPFDLVFIDADKPGTPDYLTWALKLTRSGSIIIVDNVVRDGAVADAATADASARAMRRVMEMMSDEPRLSATAIQTVGVKGYDGFALAIVS
jgi:predicted O-methyltransferase YrrM